MADAKVAHGARWPLEATPAAAEQQQTKPLADHTSR